MLKPRVGDIVSISSPLNFLSIVVLPALSKPLSKVKDQNLIMKQTYRQNIHSSQAVIDSNHLEEKTVCIDSDKGVRQALCENSLD